MGSHKAFVGNLVFPTGTDSNVLSNRQLSMARKLIFDCPATFAGTVTVYGALKANTPFASLKPIRVGAADLTLTAGKLVELEIGGYESIGLKSSVSDNVTVGLVAVLEYP